MTLPWHLPVVLGAVLLAPAGGPLSLTAATPAVVAGTVLAPAGASFAVTGATPGVNVGRNLVPAGTSATLTGATPGVTATANVTLAPAGVTAVLTGATPDDLVGFRLAPDGVALMLGGGAPSVVVGPLLNPAGASLTLTATTTPAVITPRPPLLAAPGILGLYGGTPTLTMGVYFDSFRVAALSMADYVQPAYTGTGARIYRATTATVDPVITVAGTPALLPAHTFDTIAICTADITADLTNGGFIVQTPGWYRVTARVQSTFNVSSVSSAPSAFGLCLYKNGAVASIGAAGWGFKGTSFYCGPDSLAGDFDVQLAAGDAVQIGNWVDTTDMFSNFHITGESTGAVTYTMITLLNRAG